MECVDFDLCHACFLLNPHVVQHEFRVRRDPLSSYAKDVGATVVQPEFESPRKTTGLLRHHSIQDYHFLFVGRSLFWMFCINS